MIIIFSLNPKVEDKHISSIQKNDEFYGRLLKDIKNSGMGTVKADLDCKGPPTSITCRAVVQMDSGEIVEFKYTHDMTSQPCLSLGDRVLIEMLKGNSTVRVVRLSEKIDRSMDNYAWGDRRIKCLQLKFTSTIHNYWIFNRCQS